MPSACVRTNASGSAIERSTCVSAAKLTTASQPSIACMTTCGSSIAPCTNVKPGSVADVVEVLLAPGVGELVEDDDLVAELGQPLADEVRADEAGAAADQKPHETTSVIAAAARSRR